MKKKVILLAPPGQARDVYSEAILKCGVELDAVSSCFEMFDSMAINPYCGALIDFFTKMKASATEKKILSEISEGFPMLIVKMAPEAGKILVFNYLDSRKGETVELFIENECLPIEPKIIKASERKNIVFNVIISETPKFSGGFVEKTVTANVSANGCFVYSAQERPEGSVLWIIFKEIEDKTPIKSVIRSIIPWGIKRRIPGFILEFESIRENQLREIWRH